jgi:putative hydrolase of the HAD superfamily
MAQSVMAAIGALFFDVGGVLLTNGWDRSTRRAAASRFGLDWDLLEERHELVVADFETGRLTLDQYLDRIVFHEARPFSRADFQSFLLEQSQPLIDSLAIARELASQRKYLMATLNNESAELNAYRIRQFGLRDYFTVFFTSCYLGLRKPDPRIYRLAADLTQHSPEECLFVDDRVLNVESACQVGMRAIRFESADQLRRELNASGVL